MKDLWPVSCRSSAAAMGSSLPARHPRIFKLLSKSSRNSGSPLPNSCTPWLLGAVVSCQGLNKSLEGIGGRGGKEDCHRKWVLCHCEAIPRVLVEQDSPLEELMALTRGFLSLEWRVYLGTLQRLSEPTLTGWHSLSSKEVSSRPSCLPPPGSHALCDSSSSSLAEFFLSGHY